MQLLEEIKEKRFNSPFTTPTVFCRAFEDNSGALELARLPKMRPRTKHINIVYHHFREHVRSGKIKVLPIKTTDQIADIFTKPLAQNDFLRHRKTLLNW
jgi:hypothetical protein